MKLPLWGFWQPPRDDPKGCFQDALNVAFSPEIFQVSKLVQAFHTPEKNGLPMGFHPFLPMGCSMKSTIERICLGVPPNFYGKLEIVLSPSGWVPIRPPGHEDQLPAPPTAAARLRCSTARVIVCTSPSPPGDGKSHAFPAEIFRPIHWMDFVCVDSPKHDD